MPGISIEPISIARLASSRPRPAAGDRAPAAAAAVVAAATVVVVVVVVVVVRRGRRGDVVVVVVGAVVAAVGRRPSSAGVQRSWASTVGGARWPRWRPPRPRPAVVASRQSASAGTDEPARRRRCRPRRTLTALTAWRSRRAQVGARRERRSLGLGDARRDADAAVAGAGDEQARRAARRRRRPASRWWCGRYCGKAPGHRLTRTAVGWRSRPRWPPTSATARSTSLVVVEVVDGQAVAAERDPQHLAVAAPPVRPLLRAERHRGHGALHRLRHEVAAAPAQPLGPVGDGERDDDDAGVVHRRQQAGGVRRRRRRAAGPSARPGAPARRRRTARRRPATAAPSAASVADRARRCGSSRPRRAAAAATASTSAPIPPRGAWKTGPVAGGASARSRRAPSSRLRPRPARAASCGTIARLKRSVSAA